MSRRKTRPRDPAKRHRPGIRTKIYVRDDMIGAGKIDLLRTLRDEGSISGAARAMGLGYRRAWFLLETLQRCFAEPLFVTRRGGQGPGGTALTPLGLDLIDRYDAHLAEVEAATAPFLDWLEANQPEDAPSPEPVKEAD